MANFNCPICGTEYLRLVDGNLVTQVERLGLLRLVFNDKGELRSDGLALQVNAYHCPECGHLSLHTEKTLKEFLEKKGWA